MRHWIGSSLLTVAGLGVTLYQAWQSAPPWLIALTVLLTAIGVLLMWPLRRERGAATAFIRGDASGSTAVDVSSDAQVFIEGDARETVLSRIIHSPRRRG